MASLRLKLILSLTSLLIACGVVEYMVIMYVHSFQTSRQWILPLQGISLEERGAWQRMGKVSSYLAAQNKMVGGVGDRDDDHGRGNGDGMFYEQQRGHLKDWLNWMRADPDGNNDRVGKLDQRILNLELDDSVSNGGTCV